MTINKRAEPLSIISSDEIDWQKLYLENEFIVVNYQPSTECAGCPEINVLFQELSAHEDYGKVKFLWVDSRSNPIAEQFILKRQTAFIAVFKEGFLVECDSVRNEAELRGMLDRLFTFKFKL
jgi:thiol-disulfide isomerase/thioredoxin